MLVGNHEPRKMYRLLFGVLLVAAVVLLVARAIKGRQDRRFLRNLVRDAEMRERTAAVALRSQLQNNNNNNNNNDDVVVVDRRLSEGGTGDQPRDGALASAATGASAVAAASEVGALDAARFAPVGDGDARGEAAGAVSGNGTPEAPVEAEGAPEGMYAGGATPRYSDGAYAPIDSVNPVDHAVHPGPASSASSLDGLREDLQSSGYSGGVMPPGGDFVDSDLDGSMGDASAGADHGGPGQA